MTDDLGNRMKSYYEHRAVNSLLRRTPVIVRVDGKSFHTFCKRFEKPYDEVFHKCLNDVMRIICASSNCQGVKFAERHSDEISFLLTDYDKISTDAFFDYNVQKICSVVASMATATFIQSLLTFKDEFPSGDEIYSSKYLKNDEHWPTFDARCFNIPESEVANYFHWRLLDAKRNSVSMQAQSKFSHKRLHGMNADQKKEMLQKEHNVDWEMLPQGVKTGFVCVKQEVEREIPAGPNKGQSYQRSEWVVEDAPEDLEGLREAINKAIAVKGA